MRLAQPQIDSIRQMVQEVFDSGTDVLLFGSRVDDSKRGGDIDLLIRSGEGFIAELFPRNIRLLSKLERALGERKTDVVTEHPEHRRPLKRMARETRQKL